MAAKHRALRWSVLTAALVALGAICAWWYSDHRDLPRPRPKPPMSPSQSAPPRATLPVAPPAPASVEGARSPQVWALVIGIDHYQAIPRCRSAVRDARAVLRWLARTAGWGETNILLMDDDGSAEPGDPAGPPAHLRPTRKNLDWAVRSWLRPRTKSGDVVVIYFAGQAVAVPPSRGPSGQRVQERLLPIDANPANFEETGWSLEEAIEALSPGVDRPIVCWLDTSLEGRGKPVLRPGDVRPSGARWLSKLVRWPGVTAWLAADGQPSAEGTTDHNSPFTSALLGALGTRAQTPGLLACLDRLRLDDRSRGQGFRARGGTAPGLTLWPQRPTNRVARAPELLLQRGHADRVTSLASSPDGKMLVSASMDSTIKVWEVGESSMRLVRAPARPLEGVTCLTPSSTWRWLVAGDKMGGIVVLDPNDLQGYTPKLVHMAAIEQVGFLPDESHFVSLDGEGKVRWWEIREPEPVARLLVGDGTNLACAGQDEARVVVAVSHRDGQISLFGGDGVRVGRLEGPGGFITSLALSPDGRRLAAGDDQGLVSVHRLGEDGGSTRLGPYNGRVHRLAFSPSELLAVADGETLHLAEPFQQGLGVPLASGGRVEQVAFSPDGRELACCTAVEGRVAVWRLADPHAPRRVGPGQAGGSREWSDILCVTFTGDGAALVAGGGDGSIRRWDLDRDEAREGIARHRAQVTGLSVSPDGRFLLQVTRDWRALVWDLEQGRTLTRLAGEWTSGAILPDGTGYVLTSREGAVVFIGRDDQAGRPLARPPAPDGGRLEGDFAGVTASPDGRWIAASRRDLACLWDRRTGEPTLIEGHEERVTCVGFSADARYLLTASEDGTARRYDLAPDAVGNPLVLSAPDDAEGAARALTAASICPTDPRRIVAGTRDGRVLLWDEAGALDRPLVVRALSGEVSALTFSTDGRWLAAAGTDWTIELYEVGNRRMEPVALDPRPHHGGAINALVGWPGGKLLASGSEDTTVRLWDLDRRELLGTLAAEQEADRWVIYTPAPDGLFDTSDGGEGQVTWLVGGVVRPLEQYYPTHHVLGLGALLRQGRRPEAPKPRPAPPPMLWIEPPSSHDPGAREVELTIRLGEDNLKDVRLYHDNVAIRSDADLGLEPGHRLLHARLRLHAGDNRFYAMASRPNAIDGRSEDVVLRYDGDTPGRLHILALGLSRYRERPLRFADADAHAIAEYLQSYGPADPEDPGLVQVLPNEEVTHEKVAKAFRQLRDRARSEDVVVLFLAGHTDVSRGQFQLLLSNYRFHDRGPSSPASRGGDASRDDRGQEAESVLPYADLYSELTRLDALRRLVIIDACQSGAVLDDLAVRRIQETVEGRSHPSRTSYILAARPDDPANEVGALRHGLLTYVLLRGMGDRRLAEVPDPSIFRELPDADRDHDRRITTSELREYAAVVLPRLTAQFPELTERAGETPRSQRSRTAPVPKPSLRSGTTSFPLIVLPDGGRGDEARRTREPRAPSAAGPRSR